MPSEKHRPPGFFYFGLRGQTTTTSICNTCVLVCDMTKAACPMVILIVDLGGLLPSTTTMNTPVSGVYAEDRRAKITAHLIELPMSYPGRPPGRPDSGRRQTRIVPRGKRPS